MRCWLSPLPSFLPTPSPGQVPPTRSWEVPRASLTSCLPRAMGALHLAGLGQAWPIPAPSTPSMMSRSRSPLPEPTPLHLQTLTTGSHRPPRLPAACRTEPTLLAPPRQAPGLPWVPVCACARGTEASWRSAQPWHAALRLVLGHLPGGATQDCGLLGTAQLRAPKPHGQGP